MFGQIFNFGRDPQKNSYERRDYESIDKKILSKLLSYVTKKKDFMQ